MILPVVIVSLSFIVAFYFYLKTSRSVKAVTSHEKAELVQRVEDDLDGVLTIRSGGELIIEKYLSQLDDYQTNYDDAKKFEALATTTFDVCIDFITGSFILLSYFIILFGDDGSLLAGTVGLVFMQTNLLIGLTRTLVIDIIDLINCLIIFKKSLFFDDLPQENSDGQRPPPFWPSRGKISIKNSNKYNNQENNIQKNLINVVIEHGWKVGVWDDSKIGKNYLIELFYRLDNNDKEEIKIDGKNIKSIDLFDLRSRISIIPRNPLFIKGTVRYNMDPFEIYTNQMLYDALKEVGFREISLDLLLVEGGQNLTLGQRQLVCLAIAIIKNNRIIFMEEASTDIDHITDSLINKVLKKKFKNHTVIILADRLTTIIDNDRILMMDKKNFVEFGCPHELLSDNPSGKFAALVKKSGKKNSEKLFQQAKIACRENTKQYSLELASSSSSSTTQCSFEII
ncbi:putative uncharacterized protein YKR104W [Aphidius gifuensis]|uniref:putative uncharacterized protein YKR104W n=1 Tax=Aphidius gifuensis TaxID=684658 RepID=UPI001CDB7145|nr:putative uncharacterized protein YKR104W [Aphidius gifuensis]